MKSDKEVRLLIKVIVVFMASLPLFGMVIYSLGLNHDTFFHTQRILSIENALREGQFPVRIYKEIFDGYGYGAPLFYPQLFLYFPAVLCLLGVPVVVSYNIFLIVVNIATLITAAYAFSSITKSREIGLMGAVLYELSVYRLVDLYTRASVGEFLALIFCPLVLCGLVQIARGETKKWWVLALGMSGVLQSHILTFVIMVVVCAGYVVFNIKRYLDPKSILAVLKAAVATVGVNLWFLVPFLQVSSMQVNAVEGTQRFWETDASVAQLFDVLLLGATGIENYGTTSAVSLPKTAGIPIFLGCILFVIVCLMKKNREQIPRQIYGFFLAGMLAVCMLTNFFPWRVIREIDIIKGFFEKFQFMWRFNILVILFLSIVSAYGYWIYLKKRRDAKEVLIVVSLGVCMYSLVYMNQFIQNAGVYNESLTRETGYMDQLYLTTGNNIFERQNLESNIENIVYGKYEAGNAEVIFSYDIESDYEQEYEEYYIDVPIAYYPGYVAYIDGEQVETGCGTGGVVRVNIPSGKSRGTVHVEYVESTLYLIADIVSLLCILAGAAYAIKNLLRKTKGKGRISHVTR